MAATLVTGASRGIGLEFVRQYAQAGERVYACCRDPHNAEATRAIAVAHSNVSIHKLDVTSDADIAALIAELHGQPIDVLVNNAGIGGDLHTGEEADVALWLETFRTNTVGPYRVTRALKPNLELGTERKVMTISSGRASHVRHKGVGYAYGASKAALNNAMYGLSTEWKNFIFALFAPGQVKSGINVDGRMTAEFSVHRLRAIIARLTPADNGRYMDYDGQDVPW